MSEPARGDLWRVATLNMWNRSGPWTDRLALIRDELAALDLDVLVLQEVLGFPGMPSQAEEIVAGTSWNTYLAPAITIGDKLQLGNAICSPHALLDTQTLVLPASAGEARSVAFARVAGPHGPHPTFVTHLAHQLHLGYVRCEQVKALADHVQALAPIGGPPPVIAGDMNAEPDSDEMRYLRGLTGLGGKTVYFADCWIATHAAGPGYTWDTRNAYARKPHEPCRRIDYIYVRGPDRNLRGEPRSCRLAFDRPANGVWPSDHLGVVAEFFVASRPAE